MIAEGDRAPGFTAKTDAGEEVTLAGFLERGPLVMFFYPKDFTPG